MRPRILGIDQPIRDEIIALMIRNEYSDGIGGGIDLNLTVNVPYRLTVRFHDESNGILELRIHVLSGMRPVAHLKDVSAIVRYGRQYG